MLIRRLTPAYIPSLIEIDRASFAAGDQYGLHYYEEVVTSDSVEAFGVEDEAGHIVAWSLTDLRCEPIRIRSLAVHPECRRRGFATVLVKAASSAHGSVDLLVDPENREALALYEKLGFRVAAPDPELPGRVRMLRSH